MTCKMRSVTQTVAVRYRLKVCPPSHANTACRRPTTRILFCRTPRYMWPILSEADNFLIPLGYLCLAAALRESMPDVEIKLIDCPVQKMGWGSLEALMQVAARHGLRRR